MVNPGSPLPLPHLFFRFQEKRFPWEIFSFGTVQNQLALHDSLNISPLASWVACLVGPGCTRGHGRRDKTSSLHGLADPSVEQACNRQIYTAAFKQLFADQPAAWINIYLLLQWIYIDWLITTATSKELYSPECSVADLVCEAPTVRETWQWFTSRSTLFKLVARQVYSVGCCCWR